MEAREARGSVSRGELAAWLVVGAALVWAYAGHMTAMVHNWWIDPNYSHGFLVPLVSAFLIWRQRERLRDLAGEPNPWGLVVIAVGLVVLVVGLVGHEFFLRRVSLVPVLWGLALTAWGWPVARALVVPLGYLVLMVPLPYVLYDSVAFPLRLVAASLAGGILHALGVPVLVEGNVIHLPRVVLNVVDACSGIRSLISLLAVAVLMAHLMLRGRLRKLVLLLLVLPVAVVVNALRVVLTGLMVQRWGVSVAEGMTHEVVGWAVFMVAFVVLAGLTWLLRRLPPRRERP